MHFRPSQTCPCCGEVLRGTWSRRRFLAAAGGSALGLSFASFACAEEIPTIAYESVPGLLRLPPDLYLGEVSGVALNSKGHIFVLHRGNTIGPAYGAAAAQLLEFDDDGHYLREIGHNLYAWSFVHRHASAQLGPVLPVGDRRSALSGGRRALHREPAARFGRADAPARRGPDRRGAS